MKKIPLTQDKFALVDDEDYEYLNQWKWCATKNRNTFYAVRTIRQNGKKITIRMHRVLTKQMSFQNQTDHINRNGLDNRRKNLRDATNKENAENQQLRKDNSSGYKGVVWRKDRLKWHARIQHNNKFIHLGLFNKIEDAVKARKKAENKYFTHATKN